MVLGRISFIGEEDKDSVSRIWVNGVGIRTTTEDIQLSELQCQIGDQEGKEVKCKILEHWLKSPYLQMR